MPARHERKHDVILTGNPRVSFPLNSANLASNLYHLYIFGICKTYATLCKFLVKPATIAIQ